MKVLKTITKITLLAVLGIALTATATYAQERGNDEARVSPNAAVSQTIDTTVVMLTYGRPGVKGRTYFADGSTLAPTGRVWRTGANENTVITFSNPVLIGDKKVAAGTYSLYTIPGKDEWTIIINKKLSWGTQYDEAQDLVRIKTTAVNNSAPMMEWFMIYFDNLSNEKAHLNLHWGTTKVAVPISIPEM